MIEAGTNGAVASNAGDDFHVLWAAREILRLIDVQSEWQAVTVEGLPLDDRHKAEVGEHGQIADVTLCREEEGRAVYRYLQLKYSTANPGQPWTWSRLLKTRSSKKADSSLLGRLAALMAGVGFQGDFAIVSNQPLCPEVRADVEQLIACDDTGETPDPDLVAKLTSGLGLDLPTVVKVLRRWDLSGFSASTRLRMETELLLKLSSSYDADARDRVVRLQSRVAQLMLPENRGKETVRRQDVLAWLGISYEGMLYPAPSKIKAANPYLARQAAAALAERILGNRTRPLRLHAAGGCGKTSVLCNLKALLPAGSEVVLYDCYGGGLFLASDQKRHLPQQAFTQVGNELAARFRTPLLMNHGAGDDMFTAFRNRVSIAAGLLAERHPDAVLVLCFDAVDNARKGALRWFEGCFVDLLSQASGWPDNVRVVVSCRTARLDEVGDAGLFEDVELDPFSVDEVKELVALWHPTWTRDVAERLHDLTGAVPRRIIYAIDGLPSDGAAQAIDRLMPKETGINPLFEQRIAEAGRHLGDDKRVWRVLDALARLPRPVPGHILTALAAITPEELRDIAADVGGFVEHRDGWSFHDEDFEAFVIDRPGSEGAALLTEAADLLWDERGRDRYAAITLAEVLAAADRLDRLYALVHEKDEASDCLSDPEQQFTFVRRFGFAIRCCRQASDIVTACKLLIASAEALGRIRRLEDLIVDNLDLSVRYIGDEAFRLVMHEQRYRDKRSRLWIELARQAVVVGKINSAREHVYRADADLKEVERTAPQDDFPFQVSDAASKYEVVSAIRGDETVFDALFEEYQKGVSLPVFQILAERAAGRDADVLGKIVAKEELAPAVLAPVMAAALLAGIDIQSDAMRAGLYQLAQLSPLSIPQVIGDEGVYPSVLSWHEAVLLIVECAVFHRDFHSVVDQILGLVFPRPELAEVHQLYRLRTAGERYARVHALREHIAGTEESVSEWLPPRRTPVAAGSRKQRAGRGTTPEDSWNDTLQETVSVYSAMVDVARTVLAALTSDPEDSWQKVAGAFDTYRPGAIRSGREVRTGLLLRTYLVHTTLRGKIETSFIRDVCAVAGQGGISAVRRAQDYAKTLSMIPGVHDVVLDFLTALAKEISGQAFRAKDRVDLLTETARIAQPLDNDLAKCLFDEAVKATKDLDFEVQGALAAAAAIAMAGLEGTHNDTAGLAFRFCNTIGSVVESLGLEDHEEAHQFAGWVAATNLPAGLAVAVRWHDRGFGAFDETLPAILGTGTGLTLAQRAALGTLASADHWDLPGVVGQERSLPLWFVRLALADLRRQGDVDAFLEGFSFLQGRAGREVAVLLASERPLRDLLAGWAAVTPPEDRFEPDPAEEKTQGGAPGAPAADPLRDEAGIRRALDAGDAEGRWTAEFFLQTARRVESRAHRVLFLNAAVEVAGTDASFGQAIPDILALWSDYPPVTTWLRKTLPGYIARALIGFFPWGYDDHRVLDGALQATGLSAVEQANVVLEGIERQGERIPVRLLYALIGAVAARVPKDQRRPLFEALLAQMDERVTHDAIVRLPETHVPEHLSEAVANTVFAAMGDVDRRVNWRGCHAALVLFRAGDPAWDVLVSCLAHEGQEVFKGQPFYRYGALEQLMVTLQRAAAENPVALAPHKGLVLETIRRECHVIVRELGRSVLLALDTAGAAALDPEERDFVERLNRSQLPPVERPEGLNSFGSDSDTREGRQYSFDWVDGIPYWYKPVARMFDLPMNDFLDRLENWIHGRWGYGKTSAYWKNEPRLRRLGRAQWGASRRHGSRPTIERLSYHVEWHAMMCAVGELIEERPLVGLAEWEWEGSSFTYWISQKLPMISPHWLADMRTSPPEEARFWGHAPASFPSLGWWTEERATAVRAWRTTIPSDVFDAEVEVAGEIAVAADFALRWDNAVQRVFIESALVTPETAIALARALVSARDHRDFAFPDALHHEDIDIPGFELEAWLCREDRDSRGDGFDVRRGAVADIPISPIAKTCGEAWTFDVEQSAWQTLDHRTAISISQWGQDSGEGGHGWQALADRQMLTGLLERQGRSLIIYVEIRRNLKDSDTDDAPTH